MKIRRKCRHCKTFFHPDQRNINRQRYCSKSVCKKASKAASQQRWLAKPQNRDYFRGPEQVARVQAWRQENPKRASKPKTAAPSGKLSEPVLQESLTAQAIDLNKENALFTKEALQETLHTQAIVLTGLIAKFTDAALQEDIARTTAELVRLGREFVGGRSPPSI